jgi:hypothetical protein
MVAVAVLKERDPKFELVPEERYLADIQGKVLSHSKYIRKGLADSLALLGSHSDALSSCSSGKAANVAALTVREILGNADWVQWASLNDLLPLLAEADPREFLDAVEDSLSRDPCPFKRIFEQESSGIGGTNCMTGLLWALEMLAWDQEFFIRVVILLGELAILDPGGNWNNRPANSLTTIFLPWQPQTCAPIAKRKIAIEKLIREQPDIAWNLLVSLLPYPGQTSLGSYKPIWREIIPDDYSRSVPRDYWDSISMYAEMAVNLAKTDLIKLSNIIDHIDKLPPPVQEQILEYLESNEIKSFSEMERIPLWNKLLNLVARHKKYPEAKWAMKLELVNRIAVISEHLAPNSSLFRHQRLFNENISLLFEERGNYTEQRDILEERRQKAVEEIYASGGAHAILSFSRMIESPWRVGIAMGSIATNSDDKLFLPDFLINEDKSLTQFIGGYIKGRIQAKGWKWVEQIETSHWESIHIGQFLAFLPFSNKTWELSSQLLGEEEFEYWIRTDANPFEIDQNIEIAVDKLIQYNRPLAAIRCISVNWERNRLFDNKRVVKALFAAANTSESVQHTDIHDIKKLIKILQDDSTTNYNDISQIEWLYLPIFDQFNDVTPKIIEWRLAEDPRFFCEIIRGTFKSKYEEKQTSLAAEQQKNVAEKGYQLLVNWRIPPGSEKDSTYNDDKLFTWLSAVKEECQETGHFEIGMQMIGHVFIHSPKDPDGLWIHRSIASALDAKDGKDMRIGFTTALFNSRGAFISSNGEEERNLSIKYRGMAEDIENEGYYRLADSLRRLASSYEYDAEKESLWSLIED